MNKTLIYKIVDQDGGFIITDGRGQSVTDWVDTKDFARSALLRKASEKMWDMAHAAYKDGAQTTIRIEVFDDVAWMVS